LANNHEDSSQYDSCNSYVFHIYIYYIVIISLQSKA
jgi:hypothetical protein